MKLFQPRRLLLVFITITILSMAAAGQPASAALHRAAPRRLALDNAGPDSKRLVILGSTATSLSLSWTAPDLQVGTDVQGFLNLAAPGLTYTSQPGEPRLPVDTYLLAVPAGAQVNLDVLSSQVDPQPLSALVALNPQPEGVLTDIYGQPVGGAWAQIEANGSTAIASSGNDPVRLEEAGILHGVRLMRLVFFPARPEAGSLQLTRHLQIRLSWDLPVTATTGSPSSGDPLSASLQNEVINPWMVMADADQPQAANSAASQQPGVFLEIDHSGLYRLGYQDLQPYSLTNFDPAHLRLFRGAQEVAYAWEGDGNAVFEPGESILFYADHRFSRWTDLDAYHLVYDPSLPGQHMASSSAAPGILPVGAPLVKILSEENMIYTPDCFCKALPGRDGDHWVWQKLSQPDHNPVSLSFNVQAVNTSRPAELRLWFISYSGSANIYPDHQVNVTLNGTSLGSLAWDGKQAVERTLSIPAAVLLSGDNLLTLSLPMNVANYYDQLWLDAFQVGYSRSDTLFGQGVSFQAEPSAAKAYTLGISASGPYQAVDISNPLQPVQLTGLSLNGSQVTLAGEAGHNYWLSSTAAISKPKNIRPAADSWQFQPGGAPPGADYLIITHPAFAGALQPLVNLHKAQGYSVAVVNVMGIYDTWGDGRLDPQAIKNFLSEAYSSWSPRPTYVLLVGDGSYDPRRNLTSETTFIPPYLADVDPWAGETAADNRYVTVSGSDAVPDMLLGRLPVQTLAQAQAVVEKIIQYETDPYPGPWNANVLFVSDDQDWAGNFYALNSTSGQLVGPPFKPQYLACQNSIDSFYSDCPLATSQFIHATLLNLWNSGELVLQYTGHSSWQQWAEERYFHLDDLPSLQNSRRLPLAIEMTCFTGAFQRPEPTLDEALVLLPGAGAVAAWGSTGLGVSTGHDKLSQGFFQAVFKDGAQTLGEAVLSGKLTLLKTGSNLDLLDTFNILGDPALHINRQIVPWASQAFFPLISR